jgi:hypothetical protein
MAHQEHHESAWEQSFSEEERARQVKIDADAWNGIIGILLAITFMGVFMGACTVLAITFLT